jgi:hypothetical protein
MQLLIKFKVFLPPTYVTLAQFDYPFEALWFYCSLNCKLFWLSNRSILIVPDEGLYQKRAVCTKFYVFVKHIVHMDRFDLKMEFDCSISFKCCL